MFAESQNILPLPELEKQKSNLLEESDSKKKRLEETDRIISGNSQFAKESQDKVLNLQKALRLFAVNKEATKRRFSV